MEKSFEVIRKSRQTLLTIINELPLEEINMIPKGFNNNIAWNFGHVIAAQQAVCYQRAGHKLVIDEAVFDRYKPASRPLEPIGEDDLGRLKSLLFSTIDVLEEDYNTGKFRHYQSWTSRSGVAVNRIEDAISFLTFHDGLHVGYTMALRRCLQRATGR